MARVSSATCLPPTVSTYPALPLDQSAGTNTHTAANTAAMPPICDTCKPCYPNVKIDKIEEGMTGKEVADLLYNNFDKLNKTKANKCVERKVRNIIKGENKVFNETAKNAFINKIFYTWSKKDWNTTLQYIKDNLGSAKNV